MIKYRTHVVLILFIFLILSLISITTVQAQLMKYSVSGSLAPNMNVYYGMSVTQGDTVMYTVSPQSGGVSVVFNSPTGVWQSSSTDFEGNALQTGNYSLKISAPGGYSDFQYTIYSTNPFINQTSTTPSPSPTSTTSPITTPTPTAKTSTSAPNSKPSPTPTSSTSVAPSIHHQ
jgi:hypothetical protein